MTEAKQKFLCTYEDEKAFKKLKEALTSSSDLAYPQPDKLFTLYTDGNNKNVGAVISQEIDSNEQAIAY